MPASKVAHMRAAGLEFPETTTERPNAPMAPANCFGAQRQFQLTWGSTGLEVTVSTCTLEGGSLAMVCAKCTAEEPGLIAEAAPLISSGKDQEDHTSKNPRGVDQKQIVPPCPCACHIGRRALPPRSRSPLTPMRGDSAHQSERTAQTSLKEDGVTFSQRYGEARHQSGD